MAKGKFKSYLREVQKDLHGAEKEALKEASKHLVKSMKKKIRSRKKSTPGQPPGKASGNLTKGLGYTIEMPAINMQHDPFALVGGHAPGYQLHLMELGTKERRQTTTGKSTGKVRPRPFIRPTFQEEANAVRDIMLKAWL